MVNQIFLLNHPYKGSEKFYLEETVILIHKTFSRTYIGNVQIIFRRQTSAPTVEIKQMEGFWTKSNIIAL